MMSADDFLSELYVMDNDIYNYLYEVFDWDIGDLWFQRIENLTGIGHREIRIVLPLRIYDYEDIYEYILHNIELCRLKML